MYYFSSSSAYLIFLFKFASIFVSACFFICCIIVYSTMILTTSLSFKSSLDSFRLSNSSCHQGGICSRLNVPVCISKAIDFYFFTSITTPDIFSSFPSSSPKRPFFTLLKNPFSFFFLFSYSYRCFLISSNYFMGGAEDWILTFIKSASYLFLKRRPITPRGYQKKQRVGLIILQHWVKPQYNSISNTIVIVSILQRRNIWVFIARSISNCNNPMQLEYRSYPSASAVQRPTIADLIVVEVPGFDFEIKPSIALMAQSIVFPFILDIIIVMLQTIFFMGYKNKFELLFTIFISFLQFEEFKIVKQKKTSLDAVFFLPLYIQLFIVSFNYILTSISMHNLLGCFGSNPTAGSYAYDVFNKVPKIPLGGIAQIIARGGNLQDVFKGMGGIQGIAKNIGTLLPGQGQGKTTIGGFDLSRFINNIPRQSVKGNDSNLKDLIVSQQDGVIKKILKSNYAKLVKEHQDKNTKWTDPDFPPNEASIGKGDDLPVKATWKRIPDVIPDPQFVSGKIEPSDILQGNIGDCYFLSAIAALAENDFRIKNLFPSLQISPQGIYMVRILYQGIFRQVVVDDYIPVTPQNTPLFAKPAGGRQIWVMILEKAWAKLHGSYAAIVGGLPNEVLHAFSGAPTEYRGVHVDKAKQEKLWNDMFKAYNNGAILCCGTKSDTAIQKAGLVLGHAYTILDIYEMPTRLLKIRNPWGKREWQGRGSQTDSHFWSKVPPAQKQRIGFLDKHDGIFYMLYEDFVNYFSMVDICKINDNANYLSVEGDFHKKNGEMFEFQTHQNGTVFVGLSQQTLRGQTVQVEKKGYSRATIVVSRHDVAAKGYEYKYVASTSSRNFSELSLEIPNIQPGKYVAFAKIDWINVSPDKATFSIYSPIKTMLKKSKQPSHDKFLFKTFLDHARKNKKKQMLNDNPEEWICSDFLMNEGGYGYLAFHLDQHSKRKIGIEINEKQYTDRRLVLKRPYKGQGNIKTMIEPGKELIILYRLKSQNYPSNLTLPNPKIYNLV